MIRSSMLATVLLAGCCWFGGCSSAGHASRAPSSATLPVLEVARVIARPLSLQLKLPADLQPYESVGIYAKVPGFVESIAVDRGSRVKSGEFLARLVAPELSSQRAEAQSKAEEAESQLASAQARLAADESTFQKLKAASQTPGVVSGNDLLLAQKAMESDQAQVKALQSGAEAARQSLMSLRETENYLRITAPFDGVITERNVHPGALVGPGQSMPLLRIETLHRLRLVIPVPENYLGSVVPGAQVKFSVAAFPGRQFSGKIARISHAVDVKTRTMPVELDISNPSGELTPGAFAQAEWPAHTSQNSLLVPVSAVATNLERTFVVRIRNGKAEWVDVRTGASAEKLVEVFGDLQPGDEVAVRGTDELAPGVQVNAKLSDNK